MAKDITFVTPEKLTELEQLTDTSVVLVDASGNALAKMSTDTFKEIVKLEQIDGVPTESSTNAVSSGGVYDALEEKQDALVGGQNIKNVDGTSLLGAGNIVIGVQEINVSATVSGTAPNYTFVLNNYADFYNAIVAAKTAGKIPVSRLVIGQGSSAITLIGLISNKTSTTFNTSFQDSGTGIYMCEFNSPSASTPYKIEYVEQQEKLTFDDTPTAGSSNPVASGGVYDALDDVETALVSAEERLTVLEVQHISKSVPASTVGNNGDYTMLVNTTTDNRLYRKTGGEWEDLSSYSWRRFAYRGVTFVKADAARTSPFRVEGQTVNSKHYIYSSANVVYPDGREADGDIGVVYDMSRYGDYLCFFCGENWVLFNSPVYYDGEVLAWYGDEVHVVDGGLVGPSPNASQKGRLKKDVIDCRFMATSYANLGGDDGDYALILAASNNHCLARNFNGTWAYLWNYADGQRFTFGGRTYTKATNANTDLFTETSGGLRPLYEAAGAVYNATTGYYELNGLTDITEAQMAEIYAIGRGFNFGKDNDFKFAYQRIRTNLLPIASSSQSCGVYEVFNANNAAFCRCMFGYASTLEVVVVGIGKVGVEIGFYPLNASSMFVNCSNLRTVLGVLKMKYCDTVSGMFTGCSSLRTIKLSEVKINISFADSPLLYYTSLKYLIDNAANTTAITVTVHKTIYECLTGLHTTESDAKVNQEAEETGTTVSQLWSDYQTLRNDAAQLHNISFAEP